MLLEEFEKRTNIFVPGEYFDVIHQFYMDTEMDKDQFCRAYKNNTDNLAVKIKMTYVEKRTREQVTVCQHLETKEFEWQKAIKDLKIKVDSLTKELEKEQEWKPYVHENAFSDKAYANIANNGTHPVSDKEAVQFVSEHFGFDKTKITINRMKPVYEINRHQQVRQIGAAVRNPYIFASDWNYICFSSMGIDYEIQNGTIFPYV